ncbi:hypothetical protein NY10_2409 [Carnobacterium antarcticum]|nr:hypothetical protein NY10_2409 [Carnobacterium sp. CP1]
MHYFLATIKSEVRSFGTENRIKLLTDQKKRIYTKKLSFDYFYILNYFILKDFYSL